MAEGKPGQGLARRCRPPLLSLAGFYFQTTTATRFQVVPYRGAAPAVQDTALGRNREGT